MLDWIEDPVLCGAHPESGSDGSGLDSSLAQHMCVAAMRIELVEKLKVASIVPEVQKEMTIIVPYYPKL